jgi:hypothetical protein
MATKTNMKCNTSVSEKQEIVEKEDAQSHVHTKVAEQLSIPLVTVNNIMVNKSKVLQQCVSTQ